MTKRPRPRAQEGRPPKLPYGIRDVQNSLNRHVLGIYVVRGILQIPRTDRLKKKKKSKGFGRIGVPIVSRTLTSHRTLLAALW